MDGLLVVDKPIGPSSHAVVLRVRRALRERRIGHTGTLDPMASGVLPLVLGRATRLSRFLIRAPKTYEAVVRLGLTTSTYDAEGTAQSSPYTGALPDRDTIDRTLDAFRGTFLQQPPAFSAKKIGGRRSYRIARRAEKTGESGAQELPVPVAVTAHTIEVMWVEGDQIALRIDCSAGFYVRSLAHDLGERLGTGAYLLALTRARSGELTRADAITLDEIEDAQRGRESAGAALIPLSRMLPALSAVVLTADGVRHAISGRELGPADAVSGFSVVPSGRLASAEGRDDQQPLRLVAPSGDLVGIAGPGRVPGSLHPLVVLM